MRTLAHRKKIKKSTGSGAGAIKADSSKPSTSTEIPEFEVHIGREWYVKVAPFYGNDKMYVLLRNYARKKSYGSNLPIEMIDEVAKSFQMAQAHIKKPAKP